MEITMEINADDDSEVDNDYQLYQYHRSRLRRDAAQHQQQQCGPLKCNGELSITRVTNRLSD